MLIVSISETHFWDWWLKLKLIFSVKKDAAGGYSKGDNTAFVFKKEHFIKTKCLFKEQRENTSVGKGIFTFTKRGGICVIHSQLGNDTFASQL